MYTTEFQNASVNPFLQHANSVNSKAKLRAHGQLDAAVNEAHDIPIEDVADRLGIDLRRDGHERVGPCPTCGGEDRFAVNVHKGVWHCRGCEKGGDGIELVRHVEGLGFVAAVEFLIGRSARQRREIDATQVAERERKQRERLEQQAAEEASSTENALRWWRSGQCIYDTPAETYLKSRRCDGLFPPDRDAVFRFHPSCPFGEGRRLPCLLSLLHNIKTGKPQAVHRTAITRDGQKIGRQMLGPCKGAAVKLWPVGKRLFVAEGVETALSAALHLGMSPAWACVSANGMENLPPIPGVEQLVILVDHDANSRGQRAAEACSRAWTNAGRTVARLVPKQVGTDFNDLVARVGS